jgi:2',3'-cyclic-nucleotide 2'-phosphodiesterase (5'-nucleotidase family)
VFARDVVHGQIGYAALSACRDGLKEAGEHVLVVDGGNSLVPKNDFGDGKALWELAETVGYDVRVPGNLELSQGIYAFQSRREAFRGCHWLSCGPADGDMAAYVVLGIGTSQVGFVGLSAPFAGRDSEAFYDAVQLAVDAALAEGADYVVCVSNLGTDPADSPFTAPEVIAARHMDLPVFGVSIITDTMENTSISHEEVQENGKLAEKNMTKLFTELLKTL